LEAACENAETWDDRLVVVDHKTGQPYALTAFSVGCENGMDVAGEDEFL